MCISIYLLPPIPNPTHPPSACHFLKANSRQTKNIFRFYIPELWKLHQALELFAFLWFCHQCTSATNESKHRQDLVCALEWPSECLTCPPVTVSKYMNIFLKIHDIFPDVLSDAAHISRVSRICCENNLKPASAVLGGMTKVGSDPPTLSPYFSGSVFYSLLVNLHKLQIL